jgi:hypothetical protein
MVAELMEAIASRPAFIIIDSHDKYFNVAYFIAEMSV